MCDGTSGHSRADGHAALIQRQYQTDQGENNGAQLDRIKICRFGRRLLLDAFEPDNGREKYQRNCDDENRTPWQHGGHCAADGRADGRGHCDDQRANTHKTADFRSGRLLKNNVDHQRGGDTRSDALNDTCHYQQREGLGENHDQ